MAYKKQVDDIKQQLKSFRRLVHYGVRLLPLVIIVGAIAWFFVLRSPGGQAKTSGTTGTQPKTTTSTTSQNAKPEPKVADNATPTAASTDNSSKDQTGKLPKTGPAGTLAIFVVAATVGTLFWEWRLRHIRQNSR